MGVANGTEGGRNRGFRPMNGELLEGLAFRTEIHNKSCEQSIHTLRTREFIPAIEERFTGPVTAVFQTGKKAFDHLVVGCECELLHGLRDSSDEAIAILVPVVAWADGELRSA